MSLLLGLVYLISELLLTVTRRSRSRTGTKQDRSTVRVVWLVIVVSVAAGVYVVKQLPAAALPHQRDDSSQSCGYKTRVPLMHRSLLRPALAGLRPARSGL